MPVRPSLLWTFRQSLDRGPYLLIGATLFAVKFAIDWLIATQWFHHPWSPIDYLIWPNDRALRIFNLTDDDKAFALTMLVVSLPFVWTGVMLTLHRLRSAGMPLFLVVLFFVPLVNLLLFAALSVLPSKPNGIPQTDRDDFASTGLRRMHRSIVRDRMWVSGLLAILISVPLCVAGVFLGAEVFQSYGFSLFVGGPFIFGMFVALLNGFSYPKPLWSCISVALIAGSVAGVAILFVALEGAICLIMAAPIGYALIALGALVGYAIQSRPWLNDSIASLALTVTFLLPALMAAEAAGEPEPELREVATEVIVAAPPEKVWPLVIAFPPLAEPDDWFFRTGVAYPLRAEIHGHGVGAIRHCVFSTGAFVEPIEVWDEPNLLRFQVTEQPDPMREWSPFHIHPAHLDHYLVSRKGEFRLERLPGGRTRLIGTTWYSNRMWPEWYWGLWSDYVIHRIHGRVLEHIRGLAE